VFVAKAFENGNLIPPDQIWEKGKRFRSILLLLQPELYLYHVAIEGDSF
jgi:hypothetical protein